MIGIDLLLLGVEVREEDDAAAEIVLILLDFENDTVVRSGGLFVDHGDIEHVLVGHVVGDLSGVILVVVFRRDGDGSDFWEQVSEEGTCARGDINGDHSVVGAGGIVFEVVIVEVGVIAEVEIKGGRATNDVKINFDCFGEVHREVVEVLHFWYSEVENRGALRLPLACMVSTYVQ